MVDSNERHLSLWSTWRIWGSLSLMPIRSGVVWALVSTKEDLVCWAAPEDGGTAINTMCGPQGEPATQSWGQSGISLSLSEWACGVFFLLFLILIFNKCLCGIILSETWFLWNKGSWGRRQIASIYLQSRPLLRFTQRTWHCGEPLNCLWLVHKNDHCYGLPELQASPRPHNWLPETGNSVKTNTIWKMNEFLFN